MDIKFIRKEAFMVVGYIYRGRNENQEIADMWNDSFFKEIKRVNNVINPDQYYGVSDNYDNETKEFEYIAGVRVNCLCSIPPGMVSKIIPEQEYAVFPTTLPELADAYTYIFHQWLKEEDCKILTGPSFEFYGEDFCEGENLYIYIPVQR